MFGSCSEANEILNIQSATKRQRDDNIRLYLLFGTTYLKNKIGSYPYQATKIWAFEVQLSPYPKLYLVLDPVAMVITCFHLFRCSNFSVQFLEKGETHTHNGGVSTLLVQPLYSTTKG